MFCQAKSYEVLALVRESSVEIVGTLQELPEGKTAPGGHELSVDYLRTVGAAPGGDDAFTNRLNEVITLLSSLSCIDLGRSPPIFRNRTPRSLQIFAISSFVVKQLQVFSVYVLTCSPLFVKRTPAKVCWRLLHLASYKPR